MDRRPTRAVAVVAALMMTIGGAQAADDAKYPNWKGQWDAINPRLGGQASSSIRPSRSDRRSRRR